MDDAGVYKLTDDMALVQTVDYFTPMVDDPYVFGQVAAANALSDVYAMGGRPLTALNIMAYPPLAVPKEAIGQILMGGADKVRVAGAVIAGGHTIEDKEPKYGMAVTGLINPKKIAGNNGAKPGDLLVLTKPLGVGIITTAIKGEVAEEDAVNRVIETMTELNKTASEVMQEIGINGCTDITGFGMLGHTWEMSSASGVNIEIYSDSIPLLPTTYELADMGIVPGGAKANLYYLEDKVEFDNIKETYKDILADPQTSGGLLISVSEDKSLELIEELENRGVKEVNIVGKVCEKTVNPRLVVRRRI
jgi:selenide,water dikinase